MSEPFIAEVRIFASNFAPRGWALCNGQLLPVAQNPSLFTLIGDTYGGDGTTTFGLPDLEGRAPMHPGSGPGLTTRALGEQGGEERVTLDETQSGNHGHVMLAHSNPAAGRRPAPNPLTDNALAMGVGASQYASAGNLVAMADQILTPSGGSIGGGASSHDNMQPFLAVNFIIALTGLVPGP